MLGSELTLKLGISGKKIRKFKLFVLFNLLNKKTLSNLKQF